MSRVCLPAEAFNDRRIRGSHLRALAAIATLGEGAISQRKIIAKCGIAERDLRRVLRDLEDFEYLSVTPIEGFVSLYKIVYSPDHQGENSPPGEIIPPGEDCTPQGEKKHTHGTNGVSPPDGPLLPPGPPITPLNPPTSPGVKSGRASRLPDDWLPTPANIAYAESKGFFSDALARQGEDFRDYWHARAGPGGLKLDWSKTWAMWIRTAADRKAQHDGRRQERNGAHGAETAAFDFVTRQ